MTMKKLSLLFVIILFSNYSFSQIEIKQSEFPSYQGIATVGEKTKEQSYTKIKLWVTENFPSSNVIQLDDPTNGILLIKGNFVKKYNKVGGADMRVHFSLKFECKDNRFRYTINVSDVCATDANNTSMMNYIIKNPTKKGSIQTKEDISIEVNKFMKSVYSFVNKIETVEEW